MTRAFVLGILLAATVAHAEEPTFEALGQAPVVGGDRVRARERALDEAMRQAVEQAVATLLDPKALSERAAQLKLQVYPRARDYLAGYRVLEETGDGPMFQIRISAQVDAARLARAVQAPQAVAPAAAPRAKALVCLVERRPGAPPAPSPLEKKLAEALQARGVQAEPAKGQCAAGDALDETRALALAQAAGAQGAVIGDLALSDEPPVRGSGLPVAKARARLKLIEADGATGEADGDGEAYQPSARAAEEAAAGTAVDNAVRALAPKLAAKWPAGALPGGGVLVRASGVGRWAEYAALVRALSSVPGVGGVAPRKFDTSGVEIEVRTAVAASALAAAVGRAVEPDGTRFAAEPAGDLELKVRVIPAPPPAPPAPPPTVQPPG